MSIKQRINLKFLVRLGKTSTEISKLLQKVYENATVSNTRIFEWRRRFRKGREHVKDDLRSGRPTTSRTNENVDRGSGKVRSDRRLTAGMIADELSMNSERVWTIITEDLCKNGTKVVLNDEQKKRRVQVCQDILKEIETEPDMLSRVVTDDEQWIFEYDLLN